MESLGKWADPEKRKQMLRPLREYRHAAQMSVGYLTRRQVQILASFAVGCSRPETSRILGVSERTVSTIYLQTLRKLGVETKIGAVLEAIERGYFHYGSTGAYGVDVKFLTPNDVKDTKW